MEPEFWHEVWQSGRTNFHEGVPNEFLARYVARFPAESRVLVPLCGKTVDLLFLASHGHRVVGVELSEMAARAFFSEHDLSPDERRDGAFLVLSSGSVTIWVGDYFETSAQQLGVADALYDRAALIALPEELRGKYVDHTRALLTPDAPGLVVTLEYEPGTFSAPPFSIEDRELRERWSSRRVELLEETASQLPRVVAAGLRAHDRAYWLSEG